MNDNHWPGSPTAPIEDLVEMTDILERLTAHTGLSRAAMVRLLDSPTPRLLDRLFAAARNERARCFGNTVFLYGFLYISTFCGNRCSFCYYRKSNSRTTRYRKTLAQIVDSAHALAQSGVHLIDLTAGEDPWLHGSEDAFSPVVNIVQAVRQQTGLPVMVSVGVATDEQLDRLAAAGADWYACYQETHNRRLFEQLRVGQNYGIRCRSKLAAKARGMLIEEGLLCGVGETSPDLIHSFDAMARMDADQVRVMTFVPQPGTPMSDLPEPSSLRELISIALLRIAFPHLLVPASLDVEGLAGLRQRLDAGANVVTSLVPPRRGLAGVARHDLDIEEGRRTVEGIARVLDACHLEPASQDAYRAWIARRKRRGGIHDGRLATAC